MQLTKSDTAVDTIVSTAVSLFLADGEKPLAGFHAMKRERAHEETACALHARPILPLTQIYGLFIGTFQNPTIIAAIIRFMQKHLLF